MVATCEFIRHSHSIISQPLNRLFGLAFCALNHTDTVRHTVETERWRAIGPDRSRRTPKCVLSYSPRVTLVYLTRLAAAENLQQLLEA
jgi:hypothetical protein